MAGARPRCRDREATERILRRWRWPVRKGQRVSYTFSQPDSLLAATAPEQELGVVTRNTADFEHAGILLLNPWRAAA